MRFKKALYFYFNISTLASYSFQNETFLISLNEIMKQTNIVLLIIYNHLMHVLFVVVIIINPFMSKIMKSLEFHVIKHVFVILQSSLKDLNNYLINFREILPIKIN